MVQMRRMLSALALSAVALALPMVTTPVGRATRGAPPTGFVFVSMPDTFNNDLGDVRDSRHWRRGDPNSVNQEYRQVIRTVFADVAAENPLAVLMAGDAVQGHWGRDDADTGIFGPVRTDRQRTKAMRRAAHQYYGEYVHRFDARGLPLYAAIGDHELGDNPWRAGDSDWRAWKLHHLRTLRSEWAEKFTRSGRRFALHPRGTSYDETAYAKYLVPRRAAADHHGRVQEGEAQCGRPGRERTARLDEGRAGRSQGHRRRLDHRPGPYAGPHPGPGATLLRAHVRRG